VRRITLLIGWALVCLVACRGVEPASDDEPLGAATPETRTLRVMTHDSFDVSEEVLQEFEERHGAKVEILRAGDAGVVLNQAILSIDHPLADVLYGVDNTLLSRAVEADIFVPYESPLLDEIPDEFELDAEHRALPVDYGDVCLNYDRGWFDERGLPPPSNLDDLTDPRYRDLAVVENPSTSSPGLAFMLATIDRYGESGDYDWLAYWSDLRENGVLVVEGWEDAYWGQFTYGSQGEGDRPIVVSYASSPPVEVYFAEEVFDEAPTAAVTADGCCFRQIEFVGILKGASDQGLAEAWVDFMLGKTFQEDIPLRMFVFPVNGGAQLPDIFTRFATLPPRPATLAYAEIEANREDWIEAWTAVVLR